MLKKFATSNFKIFPLILVIFLLGVGFGNFYVSRLNPPKIVQEKNTPKAFLSEIYDKIKENYWENISDAQLLDLFKLATEKVTANPQTTYSNKEQMISAVLKASKDEDSNKKLVNIIGAVLGNLSPPQRSGLFTQKQEVALKNTVENRNPETGKIEPTIFTKKAASGILYLQFKKFSPTSLDEFQKAFDNYKDNSSVYTLILDLRGNVGGAIDATAYFLGFFIGKNQYAFDFYRKGEYKPFKTPTDKLPSIYKYKQIIILVDNSTQSSAEMMAASLKKYHIGVVLGVPTKGWGTVERVFPLTNQISKDEKYSVFLVHSITLRDDNQPIEGRGVDPDINIKNPDWEQQLFPYFHNSQLTEAIKQVL